MDRQNPKEKPAQLLSDLESIRQLLEPAMAEPPLLTESIDLQSIPLLSDIVAPAFSAQPLQPIAPVTASISMPSPAMHESLKLDNEMRAAAQLLLQDIIDDFIPQIEAELKRRLQDHLQRLLSHRKP